MNISIKTIHFRPSSGLISFVENRINTLKKFNSRIESARIHLRLEKDRRKKNKVAEICMHLPGRDLVVKKRSETFEKSLSSAQLCIGRLLLRSNRKAKTLKKQ